MKVTFKVSFMKRKTSIPSQTKYFSIRLRRSRKVFFCQSCSQFLYRKLPSVIRQVFFVLDFIITEGTTLCTRRPVIDRPNQCSLFTMPNLNTREFFILEETTPYKIELLWSSLVETSVASFVMVIATNFSAT